jgi:endonuclease-3
MRSSPGATDAGSLAHLQDLLADRPAHIRLVDAALVRAYGEPISAPDGDALSGLIATVLSQHTSDVNSDRAFARLRARFPSWHAMVTAEHGELAETIRCGGLANLKAERILAILATLQARHGAPLLSLPPGASVAEARSFLTSLPGVGAKTASCVLLFNLGMPAFPVDTHVHRLARRIGFAPRQASPERVQDLVEAVMPADRLFPLHVNLIRHGRRVCLAQRPRCTECALRAICLFGSAALAESAVLAERGRGVRAD